MKTALIAGLLVLLALAASIGLALKPSKTIAEPELTAADPARSETLAVVPGGLDISAVPPGSDQPQNVPSSAGPGFYSEQEYAMFRQEYYCELARTTRLNCESVDRGAAGNEQCLKLNQYYTYSRHCGSEP